MKRLFILSVAVFYFAAPAIAQVNDFVKKVPPIIFKDATPSGWIKINEHAAISASTFFSQYKKIFFAANEYDMELKKTKKDLLGFTHYHFKEQYKGKEIVGGEFILHVSAAGEITGNGKIYTPATVKNEIAINENTALSKALTNIKARQYKWENNYFEQKLKRKKKDFSATYFPKAVLMFVYDASHNMLRLCYQFYIQSVDAQNSFCTYVDAGTGSIVKKVPLTCTCDAGTFISNWYGSRTVFTNHSEYFELEDACTESTYQTNDATLAFNEVFVDADNNWTEDNQRSAATSQWGIRTTHDWYASVFGRNGHGNNGEDLDLYQGYIFTNENRNNASYSYDPTGDDEIRIGTGNSIAVTDDFNTIDIMGHEFTHGVDQYEGALEYEKESGALDESFADIFGEYMEYGTLGSNNWGVGWHRMEGGANRPLRNFVDPSLLGDPNTYRGAYWYDVDGDEGSDNWGVHTNSGVQNQMFYLLTIGGNGWNNGQTSHAAENDGYYWSVNAISFENSIRIAYRALTEYVGNNSSYYDARNAWIQAAIDLFGACSFEAIQTGKAWYAVGIAPPSPADYYLTCGTYGTSSAYYYIKPGAVYVSNNCNTTISTGGHLVQCTSGKKVVLNPGFTSLNGSKFKATTISDCIFANY